MKIYLPRMTAADAEEEQDAISTCRRPAGATKSSWSSRTMTTCACSRPRACATSGSRVLEAYDGPSALKQLEQHPEVQLLFTDVGLPGMNGAQLVAAARALRPDIKVLFTTGYARNAIVHQGRLDSGVELITKPFTRVAARVAHSRCAGRARQRIAQARGARHRGRSAGAHVHRRSAAGSGIRGDRGGQCRRRACAPRATTSSWMS